MALFTPTSSASSIPLGSSPSLRHLPCLLVLPVANYLPTDRGFAIGWEYAIGWLTVLPFELIAASSTIRFWRTDIDSAVWITVFLVVLILIQIFGVRGYGEGNTIAYILPLLGLLT